jgi:hypothetical protein
MQRTRLQGYALTMKRISLYTVGLLLVAPAFVMPSATMATRAPMAKPPTPGGNAATLAAKPASVTFGRPTTLTGHVTGSGNSGVTVSLEQNPYPYTGGFKNVPGVANATTDANGNFTFTNVVPQLNTRYEAVAKKPKVTSPATQVSVRVAVTRRVNKATVASGGRVRFSGIVRPAHDGKVVRIQRRTATSTWRTVAKTLTLHSSTAGQSTYSKNVRVLHTGTYRVRVSPADGDHTTGTSARKKIRVV